MGDLYDDDILLWSERQSDLLRRIAAGEPVNEAVVRLEGAPAVLVLDRGHPVGVITRTDVLASLIAGAR